MSDALVSGSPDALAWRRRPRPETDAGGPRFAGLMRWAAALSQRRAARRPAPPSLPCVALLDDGALGALLRAAVRPARRAVGERDAARPLFEALVETARRAGLILDPDAGLLDAALAAFDGRHVLLAGPARRETAAILVCVAAALFGERVHLAAIDAKTARRVFDRAAPLLARLDLRARVLDGESPQRARMEAYEAPLVFAPAMTLAVDRATDDELAGEEGGRLAAAAAVVGGRARSGSRLLPRPPDRVVLLDADRIFAETAPRTVNLSGDTESFGAEAFAEEAIVFARRLLPGADFRLDADGVTLTEAGRRRAAGEADAFSPLWSGTARREATLVLAIEALRMRRVDVDYGLQNGRIHPLTEEMAARLDAPADPPLALLLAAKENLIDEADRRLRRRVGAAGRLACYPHRAGFSAPGALAGEAWGLFAMTTLAVEPEAAPRPVSAHLVADAEALATFVRDAARRASAAAPLFIVADTLLARRLAAEDPPVAAGDRAALVDFGGLVDGAAAPPHAGAVLVVGFARDDETLRRIHERLAALGLAARLQYVAALDDPTFDHVSARVRAALGHEAIRRRFARLAIGLAAGARRKAMMRQRLGLAARRAQRDTMLAFAGGA